MSLLSGISTLLTVALSLLKMCTLVGMKLLNGIGIVSHVLMHVSRVHKLSVSLIILPFALPIRLSPRKCGLKPNHETDEEVAVNY